MTPKAETNDNDIGDWFADLDRKMAKDWRLRWYYRWAKIRLDISEWWYKLVKDK